uniref:Ladderlectin-like n=2 Tax=Poecilia reticulata TaxID=8081 RepID=A0A3P9P547_POERE
MKLLAVFLLVSSVVVQASETPPPICTTQTSITCPSGWTTINNRCFLYVPKVMTWANAEKNCLSLEANLASVHSKTEYHQVQALIVEDSGESTEAWIGGSDGQQEKIWLWSDGSRMIYTNWCPGQPDNSKDNQNCLAMNWSDNKCWDDHLCDVSRPSVCVKKP